MDHLTALKQLQLIEEEENHEPSEQQHPQQLQHQHHLQTPSTASTYRISDLNNGMIQRIFRRLSILSCDNLSLVVPNNKTLEH